MVTMMALANFYGDHSDGDLRKKRSKKPGKRGQDNKTRTCGSKPKSMTIWDKLLVILIIGQAGLSSSGVSASFNLFMDRQEAQKLLGN